MEPETTVVKTDGAAPAAPPPSAPAAAPAAAPTPPATALSAVEKAFAPPTEAAPPAATGAVDGKPPAGVVTPPVTPPAGTGEVGITQLRGAYDALKAKYAPYEKFDPARVAHVMSEWERFESNPVEWYRQLGTELTEHPQYGSALKPAAKPDPEPQPDLYQVIDGEKVFLYSASQQQKWRDWNNKQTEARIEQRLNPMQGWVTRAQQSAEKAEIIQEARGTVTRVLGELRTYPHFKENEGKIADRLAKMDPKLKKEIGTIAALHLAYTQTLKDDVFPTLAQTTEKKVRDDFARKAAGGSGSAVPSTGGSTGTGQRPTNVEQLAKKLESGAYATS